jgi:hypothetical protein
VHSLFVLARIEIEVFLVALTLIVAFQLLTRKINTSGLLLEKTASGVTGLSAARVQMLLITLAAASYLISEVTTSISQGTPLFPAMDSKVFLLLGGSHSIYLGGKLNSFFNLFGKSGTTTTTPKGDQP